MRFLNLFLSGVILSLSSTVFCQDERSSIQLTLLDSDFKGKPGVTYILYHGNDSITSAITDENGQFYIEIGLEFNSDYALAPVNNPDGLGKDHLKFRTVEAPMDYILEFKNLAVRREHGSAIAFFQRNDTKHMEEFEVDVLRSIIQEHPEICIEFSQVIVHSESEKTAQKRMANFKKYLEKNGVDMSCIRISDTLHYLTAFNDDQRSRIEGAVYSLESKCQD